MAVYFVIKRLARDAEQALDFGDSAAGGSQGFADHARFNDGNALRQTGGTADHRCILIKAKNLALGKLRQLAQIARPVVAEQMAAG